MKKLDVPSWTGDEYRLHPGDDGYPDGPALEWVAAMDAYMALMYPPKQLTCFDISEMD